ncbi:hypothetical protein OAE77_00590, partial [bacterium]|nr:hypothetical protein [bacterium]
GSVTCKLVPCSNFQRSETPKVALWAAPRPTAPRPRTPRPRTPRTLVRTDHSETNLLFSGASF